MRRLLLLVNISWRLLHGIWWKRVYTQLVLVLDLYLRG